MRNHLEKLWWVKGGRGKSGKLWGNLVCPAYVFCHHVSAASGALGGWVFGGSSWG